ncbi:hypothetical protein CRM22_001225 [Opisthorchis felineus]|uniref:Uncharacterized protein n=1 Tax=Opisthorchis felineus TaxID=147828 RepID=A0A4S2MBS6_OPIFE|nr:hypothetical protein CRM22_001225 [Opisthorchis felineus]
MWTVVYLVLIADIVHSAGKYYFRLYGDKKFKKCLIECKRDYGKQKEVLECSFKCSRTAFRRCEALCIRSKDPFCKHECGAKFLTVESRQTWDR